MINVYNIYPQLLFYNVVHLVEPNLEKLVLQFFDTSVIYYVFYKYRAIWSILGEANCFFCIRNPGLFLNYLSHQLFSFSPLFLYWEPYLFFLLLLADPLISVLLFSGLYCALVPPVALSPLTCARATHGHHVFSHADGRGTRGRSFFRAPLQLWQRRWFTRRLLAGLRQEQEPEPLIEPCQTPLTCGMESCGHGPKYS